MSFVLQYQLGEFSDSISEAFYCITSREARAFQESRESTPTEHVQWRSQRGFKRCSSTPFLLHETVM